VLRYVKPVECLNLKGALLLYLEQKKLYDYWLKVIDGLRCGKHSPIDILQKAYRQNNWAKQIKVFSLSLYLVIVKACRAQSSSILGVQ